ncbi:MAG TPA: hypothetical protein VKE94_12455 [Gemmataceae bacterium]|nr:hypothetical protein [Gemmataceae bacterium]
MVFLFAQPRVVVRLQGRRNGDLCQLSVRDNPLGAFAILDFLLKQVTEKRPRLAIAAEGQAKIGSRLAHLFVLGIVLQDTEVLLNGCFRPASLEILFRFVQSLGDVRHETNFYQSPAAQFWEPE